MVEKPGDRKRELTVPNRFGIAPARPIDSVVRAVGRIVVCVEADAELRIAMMRILSSPEPSTPLPSGANTSLELLTRESTPPNACAAVATST